MGAIIKEIYDAFRAAGVSERQTSDAAKAIANYDTSINKIVSDLLVLKWMVGLVIVVEVLPFLNTLF